MPPRSRSERSVQIEARKLFHGAESDFRFCAVTCLLYGVLLPVQMQKQKERLLPQQAHHRKRLRHCDQLSEQCHQAAFGMWSDCRHRQLQWRQTDQQFLSTHRFICLPNGCSHRSWWNMTSLTYVWE